MTIKLNQDRSDTSDYPNSYYHATANKSVELTSLDGSCRTDVCIIGGGYTGLSSALHLAQRGYDVTLLEARKPGWGASGRNGGQLCSGQRKDQTELVDLVGKSDARMFWELGEEAKNLVKQLVAEHAIQCDLKPGLAHPDHKASYADETRSYVEFLQREYAYESVEYLNQQQMADLVGSDTYYGGSLDSGASHLHPLNLALGMVDVASKAGAKIYQSTVVEDYQEGQPNRVVTNKGVVQADHVIFACNGYLGKLSGKLAAKIMPINNFIIATEPLNKQQLEEINPRGRGYWGFAFCS